MISLQNIKLEVFQKDHISQYLEYAFHSYIAGNSKYNEWGLTKQEFDDETVKLLTQFIESAEYVNKLRGTNTPFNTFIRVDGKMAAACFSCELHHFMKLFAEEKIPQPIYGYFQGATLQENPQFTAVISLRHAVRKQLFGKGVFDFHVQLRCKALLEAGYEHLLGIINNPVMIKFHSQRGGGWLKQIKVQLGGKVREVYLFKSSYSHILKNLLRSKL